MSRKSKGANAERELVSMFNHEGWGAIRVAGSGSNRFPNPDVLAGNGFRRVAIEAKSSKKQKKYLTEEDLNQLRLFSDSFGAESWIGIRFNNQPWYFLNPEDLDKTKKGFVISLESAKNKGLSFEELVKKFEIQKV